MVGTNTSVACTDKRDHIVILRTAFLNHSTETAEGIHLEKVSHSCVNTSRHQFKDLLLSGLYLQTGSHPVSSAPASNSEPHLLLHGHRAPPSLLSLVWASSWTPAASNRVFKKVTHFFNLGFNIIIYRVRVFFRHQHKVFLSTVLELVIALHNLHEQELSSYKLLNCS